MPQPMPFVRRHKKWPIGLCLALSMVLLGGCATKKYVAKTADPVNAKLNEVDQNRPLVPSSLVMGAVGGAGQSRVPEKPCRSHLGS